MEYVVLYVMLFAFITIVLFVPFFAIRMIVRFVIITLRRRTRNKSAEGGEVKDERANNQADLIAAKRIRIADTVVGISFLLCMGALIVLYIADSTPQAALKRNLNGYDYFLDGREITRYDKMPPHPQDSSEHITTSVDIKKIPQLLETNILKVCEYDEYRCSSPTWSKVGSELMCTKAVWKKNPNEHYTEVCVDVVSGEFIFNRVDF